MAKAAHPNKLGVMHRSFRMDRAAFDKEKRTIKIRLSTETPVERWFGEEILDHSPASVDLDFFRAGAPALMEHDRYERCGIVESADLAGRTLEATVRFSRNAAGDACMAEIEDDTLRWVSVGYRVMKFEVDDKEEEYRAIRWQPLEASFVAIPADPNAKVLRGTNDQENEVTLMFKRSINLDAQATPTAGGGGGASGVTITKDDFSKKLEEARAEMREMHATAARFQRTHPEVANILQRSLENGTPLNDFMRAVLEHVGKTAAATVIAPAETGNGARYGAARHSPGDILCANERYKEAATKRNKSLMRSISVEYANEASFRDFIGQRTTFSATTEGISGTSGANIAFVPGVQVLNQQPLYIADLFPQAATTGDTIRFVSESTYTNAAARVAEGAAKPEQALDVGVVTAAVEKTAAWLKVTDEMFSDFPAMSAFVNQRLGYMVQALEDQQLITGTGSSQIKGVLNWTGLQTLSGATAPVDAILKAIEYVRGANSAGFAQPDAIVMHPLDWLNMRLTKDANGQYLFGGPGYAPYGVGGYSNVGMMWGLPLVSTTSITRGTALVGAFRMGGQIFRRMGLTIDTTNSDQDDFIKNLITVRAEQRMTLCIYQPNKFCSVTAIPTV